jgi:hypothetical protein
VLLRRIGEGCIPVVPGLVTPRAFRMAWVAPKLMRRLNEAEAEAGGPRAPSSSSMAFSSNESELVERLARRRRAEGVLGEVPERPRVVTESLRRGSFAAAAASGVGKLDAGACETELLRKRLEKALEVMDPRRWRAMSFGLLNEFPLSEDIVKKREDCTRGENGTVISERSGVWSEVPAARMACCTAGVASGEAGRGQRRWAERQARTFCRLEWFEVGVSARLGEVEVKP